MFCNSGQRHSDTTFLCILSTWCKTTHHYFTLTNEQSFPGAFIFQVFACVCIASFYRDSFSTLSFYSSSNLKVCCWQVYQIKERLCITLYSSGSTQFYTLFIASRKDAFASFLQKEFTDCLGNIIVLHVLKNFCHYNPVPSQF